jgi:hypothetical protein
MFNALALQQISSRPCIAGNGPCQCMACTRKKKLALLGFTEESIAEFIEKVDSKG